MSNAICFLAFCLLIGPSVVRASDGDVADVEEAKTTAPSGTDSGYDTDNCIEIILPNILQMDECLGDNLNLCKGQTTLVEGVLSLANCTVSGVIRNLSPVNALITIKDLLIALLGKLIPPLGRALNMLGGLIPIPNREITDSVCHGEIKITVPNSLGKCVDDTLKLCKEGTTIDVSLVESLGKAVACIVKDLFTKTPQETVAGLLCEVARLLSTILGKVPGGGILSKEVNQICKSK